MVEPCVRVSACSLRLNGRHTCDLTCAKPHGVECIHLAVPAGSHTIIKSTTKSYSFPHDLLDRVVIAWCHSAHYLSSQFKCSSRVIARGGSDDFCTCGRDFGRHGSHKKTCTCTGDCSVGAALGQRGVLSSIQNVESSSSLGF